MNRVTVAVVAGVAVVVVSLGTAVGLSLSRHAPSATVSSSPTASARLVFSDVTVTAAAANKESAVVMTIKNRTGGPISLMNVASPASSMNMLYYDTNMCQGNTAMTWLPNILISNNYTQRLGYKNQGVMLSVLHHRLVVGQTIPLRVQYSDFSSSRTITVTARVVAPPPGLHFVMSAMRM